MSGNASRRAWGRDAAAHVLARAGRWRRPVAQSSYAAVTLVALGVAFAAAFAPGVPRSYLDALPFYAAGLLTLRLTAAWRLGLADARWRYAGLEDALRLAAAATLSSLGFLIVFRLVPPLPPIPIQVVLLEWALFTVGVAGVWIGYRRAVEYAALNGHAPGPGRRIAIVGAGDGGNLLAREILRMPTRDRVVAILDDDPLKWGTRVQGVRVLGGTHDAARLLDGLAVDEVIVAIPSAEPGDLRRIVERFEDLDVPFKVLRTIHEVMDGQVGLARVRPLRLQDLIGRNPVDVALPELAAYVEGRTILVTGAAGSIGSELCRQIAANRPGRLILLDQAESDLYLVDLELRDAHPDLAIEAVVADVRDPGRIREIFLRWSPHAVFHAAAYKHVPLMEANPAEAVRTNLLGTWNVARMAGEHRRTERMVLLSTDKAVDPKSVMGATKRGAEVLVQSLQHEFPDTHFTAVRFGNVLDTQGSVAPLFRRQIRAGGPVTVTHPDARRFFMTIPEAVQLVLRAGLLDEARGRIAILEMGEPIRILDLARNLIRLEGKRPGRDIPIRFTSLRPGEKLHERLVGTGETVEPTRLDAVRLVCNGGNHRNGVWPRRLVERIAEPGCDTAALLACLDQLLRLDSGEVVAPQDAEAAVSAPLPDPDHGRQPSG